MGQCKFLKCKTVISYTTVTEELFQGLHRKLESPENDLFVPFPFITSTKMIYNHAKKIKKAIKEEPGLCLGQCQMVLAETYGYKGWQAFMIAVKIFYGDEVLEI